MSLKLKSLALMALAISLNLGVLRDVEAGPCKRVGEQRNKRGDCETIPTVQRRATPPPAVPMPIVLRPVAPIAPAPVAAVLPPPPVVQAPAPLPRPSFAVGTSMPTVIPASYLPGHVIDSCNGLIVLNGVFTPQFFSATSDVRTFGYHRSQP